MLPQWRFLCRLSIVEELLTPWLSKTRCTKPYCTS
ncbi:unnamed protein product [Linum tenue]|uniref:Uncharacterized protein n=1 Tax=Linum tenue TaxID=586396 RepID=A0AAV0IVK0_9ROSI|nr:unnamed protein product [Linum tenue]